MFKQKIKKLIETAVKDLDIQDDIKNNLYLTLNKEFRITPAISQLYTAEEVVEIENRINNNINKESKFIKKLFKKVSSEKNIKYQNVFNLKNVIISIKKEGDLIFINGRFNGELSFLKSKLLDRITKSDGLQLSIKEFNNIYPELKHLKTLGITVSFKSLQAKVKIFPEIEESFFKKDSIFARKVIVDNEQIDISEFRELIRAGENILFYNDQIIELDDEFIQEINKPSTLKYIDLIREHATGNNAMAPELNKFIYDNLKYSDIKLPEMKNVTLDDYQVDGVKWLSNNCLNGFGSVLADDMGLGKTLQTITTIQFLKNKFNNIKVLIIVPTAVLNNWESEIRRFSNLTCSFYYGSDKQMCDTNVVLTTYGTVTYDYLLAQYNWDLIVIDEAQKIKNYQSIIANKINLIPSEYRIALTGTPLENSLMDLWSIFNFINPGYLGTKENFKKYNIEMLKKIIAPFVLRREKDVISLPEKYVKDVVIEITSEQEIIYNQIVDKSLLEIENLSADENGKRLGIILSTITRLKQICNHPGNYSERFWDLESAKLNKLRLIINDIGEDKIIIFTQYVKMAKILHDNLDNSVIFHGGLNIKHRANVLDEFKYGDKTILIISLKAGGTGLNIVEANHVVHYDLWFNPAVENQATDRAHRRGQLKEVFVHRFISKGTFEEKIDAMIKSKQNLFNEVMNGTSTISYLSKMKNEELRELFSLTS